MNRTEEKYIRMALSTIQRWIHLDIDETILSFRKNQNYVVEEDIHGYVYCLLALPYESCGTFAQQLILFVYNHDTIVADLAGIHTDMSHFISDTNFYETICKENDWTYLCHAVLCQYMFAELEYPCTTPVEIDGQGVIITNTYVTKSYRGKHIFSTYMEMIKEFVLRHTHTDSVYYCVISLDPDVACYGPDTVKEPYVYSMEKDEPVRLINASILKHLGFSPIRLEPEDHNTDGSKLWFAVKEEQTHIIENTSLKTT